MAALLVCFVFIMFWYVPLLLRKGSPAGIFLLVSHLECPAVKVGVVQCFYGCRLSFDGFEFQVSVALRLHRVARNRHPGDGPGRREVLAQLLRRRAVVHLADVSVGGEGGGGVRTG